MSSETGHERQIEIEDVLEPFYGGGRLIGEDFDEFWSCEVAG
jgi:hypothetical protein